MRRDRFGWIGEELQSKIEKIFNSRGYFVSYGGQFESAIKPQINVLLGFCQCLEFLLFYTCISNRLYLGAGHVKYSQWHSLVVLLEFI